MSASAWRDVHHDGTGRAADRHSVVQVVRGLRNVAALALAGTLVAAGCATGSDETSEPIVPPAPEPTTRPRTEPGDAPSDATTVAGETPITQSTAPEVPRTVEMSVQSPGLGLDATVSGDAAEGGDPFGAFATCTAYRAVAGAYVVGVSDPAAALTSVAVVSAGRIDGAGATDADVRVEPAVGEPISASGTMTLDPDLAGGTYLAFAPGGARVEGTFDCEGGGERPVTMAASDVGAIEVVVLLDHAGSERVVTATRLGAEPSDCPDGDASSLIVRTDGDDTLGAITTFELDDGPNGAVMRLRAGTTVYEADDVAVSLDDDSRSGTFAAVTTDDVTIAGAFACN
jgi:hypothetical protein